MAASKQSRTVRRTSSGQKRARRGASRARQGIPKRKTEGRWLHHDDAATLWRGLCVSCKESLQRISQNVQRLVRDAGAGLERLRERAAVPAALGSESSGDARRPSSSKKRGATKSRAKQTASSSSQRKTTTKSTKKKTAAKKRTAQPKVRTTGSRKTKRAKTASGRAAPQSLRKAAKARSANTGGKSRAGRKK